MKPITAGPQIVERTAMCETLERNLNEFCRGPSPSCGLMIAPGHSELSLPNWVDVDLTQNMPLLEDMIRGEAVVTRGDLSAVGDTAWNEIAELLRDTSRDTWREPRLAVTNADVLNRGQPERVFGLWLNTCDVGERYPAQPKLLLERYAESLSNQRRTPANSGEAPIDGVSLRSGDIFLHDGRAFVFHWGASPWVEEFFFAASQFGGVQEACTFEYRRGAAE